MKIGVVIPARNVETFIGELLASIQAQTHPAHAYIAEDRSDDSTHQWLRDHPELYTSMRRNRVRKGWAGSLNAAAQLALADGCDAILTVSADDKLHPECIARCAAVLNADGGRDFVVPYAQQFGGGDIVQASLPDATMDDFLRWPPLIDEALFRRNVWETVGGYSPKATPPGTWGTAEDWDFWIRVWKAGFTRYAVIDTPLYFVRVHPDQLSRGRAEHHAATVDLLRKLHPDLPWPDDAHVWPPRHRTTRREA
ncbi:glycosyltransferase [Streptomyces sp. NPDC102279]|uniref:glycosyltransferase n=1 Tax=Streptomyces sp. NPDC102279 TaxID=3366153 RepID=UPI0037F29A34